MAILDGFLGLVTLLVPIIKHWLSPERQRRIHQRKLEKRFTRFTDAVEDGDEDMVNDLLDRLNYPRLPR